MTSGEFTAPPSIGRNRLRLSVRGFEELAQGTGGDEVLRELRAGQRSRSVLLLRALVDLASAHPAAVGPLAPPRQAWELLVRAEQHCAGSVERLLLHPQMGSWNSRCLRRLRGRGSGGPPLWMEVGHLHAAAASAALLAHLSFRITVPVRDGGIMLPALGRVDVAGCGADTAEVCQEITGRRLVTVGSHTVQLPEDLTRSSADWSALRQLHAVHAGHACTPYLDDLDPYRNFLRPGPPRPLSEQETARWQRHFQEAWRLIAQQTNVNPAGVGACILSVVPVRYAALPEPFSASSPASYGCVMVDSPSDPETFAASLIHEAQHIKLSALLDLLPLLKGGLEEVHYAPWRADPRPLRGLLQGVYAFLGVTGFWQDRLHHAESLPMRQGATLEFALRRLQTAQGVHTLRAHAELTELGRRFLAGVEEQLGRWLSEPVPEPARRVAEELAADHRTLYRLCHLRPAAEGIERWARAWRRRTSPTDALPHSAMRAGRSQATVRAALARMRFRDPTGLTRLREAVSESGGTAAAVLSGADLHWAAGDMAAALSGYRESLALAPDDLTAWAGLMLTAPEGAGRSALRQAPEVVFALHQTLRRSGEDNLDPLAVAEWVGGHTVGPAP